MKAFHISILGRVTCIDSICRQSTQKTTSTDYSGTPSQKVAITDCSDIQQVASIDQPDIQQVSGSSCSDTQKVAITDHCDIQQVASTDSSVIHERQVSISSSVVTSVRSAILAFISYFVVVTRSVVSLTCPFITWEVASTPDVASHPKVASTPDGASHPEVARTLDVASHPQVASTPEVASTSDVVASTPEVASIPDVASTPDVVASTPEVASTPDVASTLDVASTARSVDQEVARVECPGTQQDIAAVDESRPRISTAEVKSQMATIIISTLTLHRLQVF